MMTKVETVLSIAHSQLGTKENPPNSNIVKYNDWFWKRHVEGKYYPWCMAFCQWVYAQAGVKLPYRTASCGEMMTAAKQNNCYVTMNYKPGDLLLFDFTGQRYKPTHCGILYEVDGQEVRAIEGNTAIGNDSNGGEVMMRTRPVRHIVGAVRPKFDLEVEDMTIDEFVKNLTTKQAYDILTKAKAYADAASEPSWSKKEGHWAAATAKKIVDGKAPEGLVKRDEMVAILGRMNLIER